MALADRQLSDLIDHQGYAVRVEREVSIGDGPSSYGDLLGWTDRLFGPSTTSAASTRASVI